jgi:hypothetical protein
MTKRSLESVEAGNTRGTATFLTAGLSEEKSMYDVVSGSAGPCCGSCEGPQRETHSPVHGVARVQARKATSPSSATWDDGAQFSPRRDAFDQSIKISMREFQGTAF